MTRTFRVRAASISIRTKSSGSSSRRLPCSSAAVSHLSPITASSTSVVADRVADLLDEVVSQVDRVDVLEDLILAEPFGETVV